MRDSRWTAASVLLSAIIFVGGGCGSDSSSPDTLAPDQSGGVDLTKPPIDGGLPDTRISDRTATPDLSLASDLAVIPDKAIPDQAVPDKAVPDQAAPDKAVPDQAAPDQAAPDKAMPDKGFPDALVPDLPQPTCTDQQQNGAETDVDCGGAICPKCADTKKCSASSDCVSGDCVSGACVGACGSGADGALTVPAGSTVDVCTTNTMASRSCADGGDAVSYSVIGLTGTKATLAGAPATGCLAAGDEVLLINLQGTPASANVGRFETLRVASVSGADVTFAAAKANYYGAGPVDDTNLGLGTTNERVVLQRVPNYGSLTVAAGGKLTCADWDGVRGGVFFVRVSGEAVIEGSIDMSARGYRGGARPTANSQSGNGGESYLGLGTSSKEANGGGGGAGQGDGCMSYGSGGGGGGFGGNGLLGPYYNPGSPPSTPSCTGRGGLSYGSADLTDLFLGSGGGSGGNDNALHDNPLGGAGGRGGGAVVIAARKLTIQSGGELLASGTRGQGDVTSDCPGGAVSTTSCWDWAGPGGGGSGGSILLSGDELDVGSLRVQSAGGAGGLGSWTTHGGRGGEGRVAFRYRTMLTGTSTPVASETKLP